MPPEEGRHSIRSSRWGNSASSDRRSRDLTPNDKSARDNAICTRMAGPGQPCVLTGPMNEEELLAHRKVLEREKARIMEDAAAKAAALDREFAELQRLAAKFNIPLGTPILNQASA